MSTITVNGIRAYGYHGCMEEEAKIGQLYYVDVSIEADFLQAAEEDNLSLTVDYVTVNRIVQENIKMRAKLIETVSLRIAKQIKELERVDSVTVKLCKPAPPINGDVDSVCTTVTL